VLSSTNPEHQTTWLRLSSARHRIRAFLEQVQYLRASSFPHPDGKEALEKIHSYFNDLLKELDLPEDATPAVVDRICAHSVIALQKYTPVLGFILRSTNVRNAFEVHHPLKRIVQKLLGNEAKILISSEWDFVPFTYPMSLDILPKFALVGGPATESNNVLILPLAGHEIGHSVWRAFGCVEPMQLQLAASIEATFQTNLSIVAEIVEVLKLGDLGEFRIKQAVLAHGMKQLEEVFCDAVGLGIFSQSFLYAYEYFMAPGGGSYRSFNYPSDMDRIKYLKIGCEKLSLTPDPILFSRWIESKPHESMDKRVLRLLDEAVAGVANNSIDTALQIMADSGLVPVSEGNIKRIESSFSRGEPEDEQASVAEIVCAGWSSLRKRPHETDVDEHETHKFIGELMLKSIEISEFRARIEGYA
jgi:hypothetical protein